MGHYIRFVQHKYGANPFVLKQQWGAISLIEFRAYLMSLAGKKKLSSYSIAGVMSGARQVMKLATSLDLTTGQEILNAQAPPASRETDAHEPYTDKEIEQITAALARELVFVEKILSGYKITGIGRDPMQRLNVPKHLWGEKGLSWTSENMRWYFENRMGCIAKSNPDALKNKKNGQKQPHRSFFSMATNRHGGLHKLYREWGVTAQIDTWIVMPLLTSLALHTGLNPHSLYNLQTDCIVDEHPLTGMPCLRYEKDRSQGGMELHIGLIDGYEEYPLKREQSVLVRTIVKKIIGITKRLRDTLPLNSPIRNRLFIYESSGVKTLGRIAPLDEKKGSNWYRKFSTMYQFVDDGGRDLVFNIVRFRPTKLTDMARQGRDYFEIQSVAGHKSINTTLRYISGHVLDERALKEVSAALNRIVSGRKSMPVLSADHLSQSISYPGIVANCRNPWDPPKQVRASIDFLEGSACSRQSMCLFCKNVVVTEEHLPILAHYRIQLSAALSNNSTNIPYSSYLAKLHDLLDQILDPEKGEFSKEEIEKAISAAGAMDVLIDPVVYIGSKS